MSTWTCPKCEKVFEPDPRLKKDPYAHFCVKDEPLDFSQVPQAKRCMKLYVAGPMSGLPEYNYPAFHKASADLRAAGYEVLNPADTDRPLGDPWQAFMRDAIGLLIQCDGVALLDGWQDSRGARVESNLARNLGMTRWTITGWLIEAGVNPYEKAAS